jgi:hypothetical protein
MLGDHPAPDDFAGFLRNASEPGHATRNARILRHLLASCPVCRGRLEAMGWNARRLARLIHLSGRTGENDVIRDSAGYNYDHAFARTERIVGEFLAEPLPSSVAVGQLLLDLDQAPREEQISLLAKRLFGPWNDTKDLVRESPVTCERRRLKIHAAQSFEHAVELTKAPHYALQTPV